MKTCEEMAESVLRRSGEIIEERNRRRRTAVRAASVSCLCLVLVGVGVWRLALPKAPETGSGTDAGAPVPGGAQDSSVDGSWYSVPGQEEGKVVSCEPGVEQDEPPRTENGEDEVYMKGGLPAARYSELVPEFGELDAEILESFGESAGDIEAFKVSMLAECAAIYEGRITNMYLKQYDFKVEDDKFGEGGTLNYRPVSVVYEMVIEKVWFGDAKAGDSFVFEDQAIFRDEILAMKPGKSYVVPFVEEGEEIWHMEKPLVSGDARRVSTYTTLYPWHPQIECNGGGYIVSTDWETLSAGKSQDIIMDANLEGDGLLYRDRMVFVPADVFSELMGDLVEKVIK